MRPIAFMGSLASTAVLAVSSAAWATTPVTSWANTATQGISLSSLVSAADLGPLPISQPITVRLALAPQNKAALEQFVQAVNTPGSPQFAQFITPAQFASTYGATTDQVSSVVSYLQSAGFSNIVVEPNNLLISADGNAEQVSAAFNTTLEKVLQFNNTGYVNITPAQVPASLGGLVTAVLGLNDIGTMRSMIALPSTPVQYLVSYTPKQFQQIYSADGTQAAANTAIAIMTEGNMTGVISDLRVAEAAFGLPQVPVKVVQVGLPSSDTSGSDEWDMDTQYSTGIAGTVKKLYLYTTTSLSNSDLALDISRWATDDVARAASASLGECEVFPFLDGSMLVDDMSFLQAAAQGQTFFASSGDTGSFCPVGVGTNGVPAGAPFVSYPASSPYVVSVGGTTLLTNNNGNYYQEIAWNAGGGGLSQFESAPYWQRNASALLSNSGDRGVPDIAMDADPESGATVYVNGSPIGVGGTSLSSPLALGIWARTLTAKPTTGFASPAVYSLYDGSGVTGVYPHGGFHDITAGANGAYTALPGYDLTTGLGSPIINQFIAAIP